MFLFMGHCTCRLVLWLRLFAPGRACGPGGAERAPVLLLCTNMHNPHAAAQRSASAHDACTCARVRRKLSGKGETSRRGQYMAWCVDVQLQAASGGGGQLSQGQLDALKAVELDVETLANIDDEELEEIFKELSVSALNKARIKAAKKFLARNEAAARSSALVHSNGADRATVVTRLSQPGRPFIFLLQEDGRGAAASRRYHLFGFHFIMRTFSVCCCILSLFNCDAVRHVHWLAKYKLCPAAANLEHTGTVCFPQPLLRYDSLCSHRPRKVLLPGDSGSDAAALECGLGNGLRYRPGKLTFISTHKVYGTSKVNPGPLDSKRERAGERRSTPLRTAWFWANAQAQHFPGKTRGKFPGRNRRASTASSIRASAMHTQAQERCIENATEKPHSFLIIDQLGRPDIPLFDLFKFIKEIGFYYSLMLISMYNLKCTRPVRDCTHWKYWHGSSLY
eukprot:g36704.t1